MNGLARHHPLDHRVPALAQRRGRSRRAPRAARSARLTATLGERGPHVEPGQHPRGALDPRDRLAHRRAERAEQLGLAHGHPLLGAEHPRLVVLELRRDVPLGAGERLPPLVVGGHLGGVGVGDLEVVAEHLVEADLERRDPGALALALLERGDVLPSRRRGARAARRARRRSRADRRRRRPSATGGRSSRPRRRARRPGRPAGRARPPRRRGRPRGHRPARSTRPARSAPRTRRAVGETSRAARPARAGVARPAAARPASRSTSRTPSSASRSRPRPRPSRTATSTASSR